MLLRIIVAVVLAIFFSCITKKELILELSQKASSSKINLLKSKTLRSMAYKNRIDKPR